MIGTQLGHFRILDRLGAGGMGEVWLAEDVELGRKVALKALRSDVAATPAQRARLQREARAVAALNHPNIVTLFSFEEAEGTRFLVMEYVEGEKLSDRIPTEGLAPREALRIGAAIADALATAHAQGIVHRDLKPGNVLLTPDGRVKVVDFGLARAYSEEASPFARLARDTSLTQEGLAVGTLHYMSPEQLEGATLDARSDLYSLGVLLHEMVTGALPFAGESAVRVISAILRDRPGRVDVESRHLPPAIADLIERLLAKEPDDRPESAAEVRDLLLDAQRLLGSATTMVGIPRQRRRSGGRRRSKAWRRTLVAVAVLLPLAALALWLARAPTGGEARPPGVVPPPPAIAVLPIADFAGDPDFFVDGMTDGLIGALARINGVRVISRQSVMHYKGSSKRLPEIARELGVDYVVETSLRREPGRLRVQAQLFRPDPETQVWSDAFARPEAEVLALHADVARAVAGAVHVALPVETSAAQTVEPAVYEAYLRGQFLFEQARPESLAKARAYFEEALRRNPRFAPAHVGLAKVYGLLALFFESPAEYLALQEAEAKKAIEIDPDLPGAHLVLGEFQRLFHWDWAASEASYKRALELDFSSVEARRRLWALYASLGRLPEARAEIERARQLDPISSAIENDLGLQSLFEGDLPAARAGFERALELDPDFFPAHGGLWAVADLEGDDDTCRHELAEWVEKMGYASVVEEAKRAREPTTCRQAARQFGLALESLSATRRVSIGLGAALLATGGESARASAWLQRAFAARDPELVWLAMDPSWRSLRSTATYQSIVAALQLQPPAVER